MSLKTFCLDQEVLENFRRLQNGDTKAKEWLAEKIAYLCIGYEEIYPCLLKKNCMVSKQEWESQRDDARQDIILKLMENKLQYKHDHGKLLTYFITIIIHWLIDQKPTMEVHKKKVPKEVPYIPESEIEQDEFSHSQPQSHEAKAAIDLFKEQKNSDEIRLKKEYLQEVQMQTCLKRTILKLWRPYLFQYRFERDECRLLESKSNTVSDLQDQLRIKIHQQIEKASKNIAISPNDIAGWLQCSRNSIDRHLTVLRDKLPWLQKEKLSEALATQDISDEE